MKCCTVFFKEIAHYLPPEGQFHVGPSLVWMFLPVPGRVWTANEFSKPFQSLATKKKRRRDSNTMEGAPERMDIDSSRQQEMEAYKRNVQRYPRRSVLDQNSCFDQPLAFLPSFRIRYFFQLTRGCGREGCENLHCASGIAPATQKTRLTTSGSTGPNKALDPNRAAALSLKLAQDDAHFCPANSPPPPVAQPKGKFLASH